MASNSLRRIIDNILCIVAEGISILRVFELVSKQYIVS